MDKLTNLYVWKNCVSLGYPVLESVLATIDICDEAIFCVDPTSDADTLKLVDRLCEKYSDKAWRLDFVWPENAAGDGSKIGIATQYAYDNARTKYVLNVQADEAYPVELAEWLKDNWLHVATMGYDGFRIRVVNTEFNAQQYQGGDEGSTWNWQCGAGYNQAIKLVKKCPAIKVAHDAWSFDGVSMMYHVQLSEEFPIIHLHDFARDHYIDLRQNAANTIWTDRVKFGHYAATANSVKATKDAWYNDAKWINTSSPFERYLTDDFKALLGKPRYDVNWSLLD